MTDEEVAIRLTDHENEIGSLKHRLTKQEEQTEIIQSLVLSVNKLAYSVESMVNEQKAQGERLKELEDEPRKQWSNAKRTLFNAILGALGSAIGIGLIYLMVNGIGG